VTIDKGKDTATRTQTRSCRTKQFYYPENLTILLCGVLKERQSILVGLAKVSVVLAPILQFYFYIIDRKSNGYKMVKGTCLAAPQRKTGTPRRLGPRSPRRMAPAQRYLCKANTSNQSTKCNKHMLNECIE
jgi:hypothetical protein